MCISRTRYDDIIGGHAHRHRCCREFVNFFFSSASNMSIAYEWASFLPEYSDRGQVEWFGGRRVNRQKHRRWRFDWDENNITPNRYVSLAISVYARCNRPKKLGINRIFAAKCTGHVSSAPDVIVYSEPFIYRCLLIGHTCKAPAFNGPSHTFRFGQIFSDLCTFGGTQIARSTR